MGEMLLCTIFANNLRLGLTLPHELHPDSDIVTQFASYLHNKINVLDSKWVVATLASSPRENEIKISD